MENSIVPGVSHLLIHWLLATIWLMYTCTVLCWRSLSSCVASLRVLLQKSPTKDFLWNTKREMPLMKAAGSCRNVWYVFQRIGWWFPEENPECTVLCVYTHDSPWVTKRCLKQTIFMWSFMLDIVDHSRVILKVPDETGCDYINASYINVSGRQYTLRSCLYPE